MFHVPENNDGLQLWGVALNCGGSHMNALRINSQEDKSLSTSAAVIRSIAKTTVCLVIMVLAAAHRLPRLRLYQILTSVFGGCS